MTRRFETGFTIIEVMLFLAITGALTAAIFVGSGVSIGQQRYKDSVSSLKSYLQQQYNEVSNVINSRDNEWKCDSNAEIVESGATPGQTRGSSNCVVLGRFVKSDDTGEVLTSSTVIGYKDPNLASETSDIAELVNNYAIKTTSIDQDNYNINWGSSIVKEKTTTPLMFSMLIIKSPLSGSVMTFTSNSISPDIKSMINIANMSSAKNLCVNPPSVSFVGKRMGVKINAYATSQSAIEIPRESESICD